MNSLSLKSHSGAAWCCCHVCTLWLGCLSVIICSRAQRKHCESQGKQSYSTYSSCILSLSSFLFGLNRSFIAVFLSLSSSWTGTRNNNGVSNYSPLSLGLTAAVLANGLQCWNRRNESAAMSQVYYRDLLQSSKDAVNPRKIGKWPIIATA